MRSLVCAAVRFSAMQVLVNAQTQHCLRVAMCFGLNHDPRQHGSAAFHRFVRRVAFVMACIVGQRFGVDTTTRMRCPAA